jgi:hypothetical protein
MLLSLHSPIRQNLITPRRSLVYRAERLRPNVRLPCHDATSEDKVTTYRCLPQKAHCEPARPFSKDRAKRGKRLPYMHLSVNPACALTKMSQSYSCSHVMLLQATTWRICTSSLPNPMTCNLLLPTTAKSPSITPNSGPVPAQKQFSLTALLSPSGPYPNRSLLLTHAIPAILKPTK